MTKEKGSINNSVRNENKGTPQFGLIIGIAIGFLGLLVTAMLWLTHDMKRDTETLEKSMAILTQEIKKSLELGSSQEQVDEFLSSLDVEGIIVRADEDGYSSRSSDSDRTSVYYKVWLETEGYFSTKGYIRLYTYYEKGVLDSYNMEY